VRRRAGGRIGGGPALARAREPGQERRTRRAAWQWGEAQLRARGLPPEEARLEAEVLLRHAAALSREELLVRPLTPLAPPAEAAYAELIGYRMSGHPTAYLVGHREFFGLDLRVDERVLIPRPETERLVEVVRDALQDHPAPLIVDIGTGSGAVAIALARALPRARLLATDTSAGALEVARANAARCGVAERIAWGDGAGLAPLAGRGLEETVDGLASNPPYVPTAELARLPEEVREHEPQEALDGGPDGLAVHRVLVAGAWHYLRPGGVLAVEVAAPGGQARAVASLIAAGGAYTSPTIVRDFAGAERVVIAAKKGDDAGHRD
jgi:release factor glutamine methyltransferase